MEWTSLWIFFFYYLFFFKLNYLQNHVLGSEADTLCSVSIWISFFFSFFAQLIWTSRVCPFVSHKVLVSNILALSSPCCSLNGLLYYLFWLVEYFISGLYQPLWNVSPLSLSPCPQFWIYEKSRFFEQCHALFLMLLYWCFPLLTVWY